MMSLNLLLDMAASGYDDRIAISADGHSLSYTELKAKAGAVAAFLRARDASGLTYISTSSLAFPVGLFGASAGGVPFIPLNYRLSEEQLVPMVGAHPGAVVVAERLPVPGANTGAVYEVGSFLDALDAVHESVEPPDDSQSVAVLLYTSGTTGTPKAAILRHRHLTSYVFGTVEFAGADPEEAALVTVPPYHIAGIANLLSNVYAGRRIVYLESFDAKTWIKTVQSERITQAMVVPTMLSRIIEELDRNPTQLPTLRSISYGGARMPLALLERALDLFPDTGFVNAYGLTETSSTIALLGPEDHRIAIASEDPAIRLRLTSVGMPVAGIDVEVRDEQGAPLKSNERGLVFLRGEQVSGEYEGRSVLVEGWFPTNDQGWIDDFGFLYIEGRADDTIIRGGENIAPAEIEDVLLRHPAISDAVVVGMPDETWGQQIAAVVVAASPDLDSDTVREWAREHLRTSKTPERVEFWEELPRTPTGKLLRRQVIAELSETEQ
jgi:acyl-CoA synthetase (AMP-forming)/AMP-acid ligase II